LFRFSPQKEDAAAIGAILEALVFHWYKGKVSISF